MRSPVGVWNGMDEDVDDERPSRSERESSMWYCPECETWVGWRLDECLSCRGDRPRWPLRYVDVWKPSWEVTDADERLGLVRSVIDDVQGWIRRE